MCFGAAVLGAFGGIFLLFAHWQGSSRGGIWAVAQGESHRLFLDVIKPVFVPLFRTTL